MSLIKLILNNGIFLALIAQLDKQLFRLFPNLRLYPRKCV